MSATPTVPTLEVIAGLLDQWARDPAVRDAAGVVLQRAARLLRRAARLQERAP